MIHQKKSSVERTPLLMSNTFVPLFYREFLRVMFATNYAFENINSAW